MMHLAHKIRLRPTKRQEQYFQKACGITRFAYNWGLEEWKRVYEGGEKPTVLKINAKFTKIKKYQFPWILEVTKCAPERAFINLGYAFACFFTRVKSGKLEKGYPKFHKKGIRDSFYMANNVFRLKDRAIYVPKLGWVKMREALRFSGKILSATISRIADKWFVSVTVEIPNPPKTCESQEVVGVDLGIKTLATLSNGQQFFAPKPLKKYLKKLKRMSRWLSRKQKGSKNRAKARMELARLYYKISCIREDFLHKLTSLLTKQFGTIVIEDLNVFGMMKNRHLSRAISDLGWGDLRRQLEYKTGLYGSKIKVVDRFFPSSKTCSECGCIKDNLKLSDRIYKCEHCGFEIDRDLNAAINLKSTVGYTESHVCGQKSAGQNSGSSETFLDEAGTANCTFVH